MLASRLLSILMLLQTRGRMSARELAADFEVSVRTIHRDIDQLSAAGVPVYADRGRAGGFQLMDGYRTRLTGLTASEAEALLLAGLPGPAAELGLSDTLAAARLKLLAAMPPSLQGGAERIASRFHLDPVGWFRGAEPLPQLQAVAQAVWSERRLELRYGAGGDDRPPLRLEPLGLVLKGGVWYLVAQHGRTIRTYRVAAIREPAILDEAFARPKDFDLAAYWTESSQAYEAGLYRERADVRLSPLGVRLLPLLGSYAIEAARGAESDDEGWVRCLIPIEGLDDGVRELMRLGCEAEVVGPPELRAGMIAALADAARVYALSR